MFRASSKRPRGCVLRTTIAVSIYLSVLAALATAQWNESVLYSFQGGTDGQWPVGRIVLDSSGNLYGATRAGGSPNCWAADCGTIYLLKAPEPGGIWTENILHVFGGYPADGSWPQGGLVMDSAGNVYGSTGYGGTGNCTVLGEVTGCGTVYELSPPAQPGNPWIETILYNFRGGSDGFVPDGDLVFDNAGNLYGATLYGGGHGNNCGDAFYQYCGTIYELSPPKQRGAAWTEKVLHTFSGIPSGALIGDGANPNGGLVLDSAGGVYGTTQIGGIVAGGGAHPGWGMAFELTPPAEGEKWTETVIYRFLGGSDGWTPSGDSTSDAKGNLYTTTAVGGNNPQQYGTVSELARQPDGQWRHYILHSFSGGNDGGAPQTGVVFDTEGNLYGAAAIGGTALHGTVFELRPTGSSFRTLDVLYDFGGSPNGGLPDSSLTIDGIGDIYGTTNFGGTGTNCDSDTCGVVFKLAP